MPRPVRSQGRGGTPVMPSWWSSSHSPPWRSWRLTDATLRRPGGVETGFDPETGGTYTPHAPYWSGRVRLVLARSEEREQVIAEQAVTSGVYAVDLDAGVEGIELGDVLTVTGVQLDGDVELVGAELHVAAIQQETSDWGTRLLVWRNLETQEV